MLTSSRRLALLPAGAIALPTLVLAYLGLQSVQDDGLRIQAEQQRLAALSRAHFHRVLDGAVEALRQVPDPRGPDATGIRDVPAQHLRHVFALDRQRRWVVPRLSAAPGARVFGTFAQALADAGSDRGQVGPWTERLAADCRDLLRVALPLVPAEREFLRQLNERGQIRPELVTDDPRLQDVVRQHPGLLRKAQNVREQFGPPPV